MVNILECSFCVLLGIAFGAATFPHSMTSPDLFANVASALNRRGAAAYVLANASAETASATEAYMAIKIHDTTNCDGTPVTVLIQPMPGSGCFSTNAVLRATDDCLGSGEEAKQRSLSIPPGYSAGLECITDPRSYPYKAFDQQPWAAFMAFDDPNCAADALTGSMAFVTNGRCIPNLKAASESDAAGNGSYHVVRESENELRATTYVTDDCSGDSQTTIQRVEHDLCQDRAMYMVSNAAVGAGTGVGSLLLASALLPAVMMGILA